MDAEGCRYGPRRLVRVSRPLHVHGSSICPRVGLVGEAAGVSTSAGVLEGHDVPPDVLASVVHWLLKGGGNPVKELAGYRQMALVGSDYCCNGTCEVVGRGLHWFPFQLNLSASFHLVTQN